VFLIGCISMLLALLAFLWIDTLHPYRWALLIGGKVLVEASKFYRKRLLRRLADK